MTNIADLDLHCLQMQGISGYSKTRAQLFKANDIVVNDSLKFTWSDTQICWYFLLKKCE